MNNQDLSPHQSWLAQRYPSLRPTGGVWFPLNSVNGQQQDFGGGNFSIAAPTGTPLLTQGLVGPAVAFGSGNYYRTTSTSLYPAKNFTMAAWVYTTSLAGTQMIIIRGNNTQRSYNLFLSAVTGTVVVAFSASAVFKLVTSTGAVALNRWTHVVGSYDGANIRVYINGVLDASTAETSTPDNVSPLGIGTYGATLTTDPFVGSLSDIRIYPYALQAGEINALYNSTFTPGLFFEGIGMPRRKATHGTIIF